MTVKTVVQHDTLLRLCRALILLFGCLSGFILLPAGEGLPAEGKRVFRDNFYDVAIQGPLIWIVGYQGTILHSRDRGLSWTAQKSGTSEALFRISFVDSNVGWVSGSYGTILHTTNGGERWHAQSTPTEEHLLGLQFLDRTTGWAVGSRGTVLHSRNGGATWVQRSLKDDVILNDVAFLNAVEGWVIGEFGRIYRTGNGGRTWRRDKSPVEVSFISGKNVNLFRLLLYGRDDDRVPTGASIFGMDGLILKRRRRGRWDVVHENGVTNPGAPRYHLFDAAVARGETWAVGERGTVISLAAGAESVTKAVLDVPPVSLNGIAFGADGLGLIVGNRGTLVRTQDWGKKWTEVFPTPRTLHHGQ